MREKEGKREIRKEGKRQEKEKRKGKETHKEREKEFLPSAFAINQSINASHPEKAQRVNSISIQQLPCPDFNPPICKL